MADGLAYCWGENGYGEVGPDMVGNPSGVPQTVGLTGIEEMALGRDHTCALLNTGAVQCWGSHARGQLGDPMTFSRSSTTPLTVATIDDATSIAAGDRHTCVTRPDQSVWCWGSTESDQLCDPQIFDDWSADPLQICVDYGPEGLRVSAAGSWTVVHDSAGIGRGWGDIPGFDANGVTRIPWGQGLNPIAPASATWAGANSWCRLEPTGLVCMGAGPWDVGGGLLIGGPVVGDGAVPAYFTRDLPAPKSVALGYDHHCAVEADGDAICWGRNESGQLGNGTTSYSGFPVFVTLPDD